MISTKKLLTLSSAILATITLVFSNVINSDMKFDYQTIPLEIVNIKHNTQINVPEEIAILEATTNKKLSQRALGLGIISFLTIVGEISAFSLRRSTEHRKIISVNDLISRTGRIRGQEANMDAPSVLLALKSDKLGQEINKTSLEADLALENELDLSPNYLTNICHHDTVTDIKISPNGDYLATRSYGTVKLLQVSTQQEIATISYSNGIKEIEFSSNGDYLATRSFDGTTKLIQVSTGEQIDVITIIKSN
ncbi:MAG: hypothetical protein QNJ18_15870 [Xenococcaceae cyanobacterium MO_167.B52]|nr:hypothetical protein [Xenococcaceae cyanobacterium MO_167.B52]